MIVNLNIWIVTNRKSAAFVYIQIKSFSLEIPYAADQASTKQLVESRIPHNFIVHN